MVLRDFSLSSIDFGGVSLFFGHGPLLLAIVHGPPLVLQVNCSSIMKRELFVLSNLFPPANTVPVESKKANQMSSCAPNVHYDSQFSPFHSLLKRISFLNCPFPIETSFALFELLNPSQQQIE